jgi:hypothetical protein
LFLIGKQHFHYLCGRIDVERFVLLATTGKNAKTILIPFLAVRQKYPFVDSLLMFY